MKEGGPKCGGMLVENVGDNLYLSVSSFPVAHVEAGDVM